MDINYLKPLLENKISELGYEAYSISSKKEAGTLFLSIVVDKIEPIDMKMISDLSEQISSFLDEVDTSEEPYTLDISSLGAEKPLKVEDLNKYVGRYVNVHVTNPINGINIFEGDLKEVSEDEIKLCYREKTRVKEVTILQSNIYKVRLAIKF